MGFSIHRAVSSTEEVFLVISIVRITIHHVRREVFDRCVCAYVFASIVCVCLDHEIFDGELPANCETSQRASRTQRAQ